MMRKTIMALAILWPMAAGGHEWYPTACCDQEDCAPAPRSDFERTPSGWRYLPTGQEVHRRDVLDSPDEQFHVCTYGSGVLRSHLWGPFKGNICVWVPVEGNS